MYIMKGALSNLLESFLVGNNRENMDFDFENEMLKLKQTFEVSCGSVCLCV
jgi:hypothetical protein